MTRKITLRSIARAVSDLIAEFAEHKGALGDAHLPATQERNGFMSITDKGHVDMRCRYAITVNDGSDVLTLNPGVYIGRSFKNGCASIDSSLCLVEITGAAKNDYLHIEQTWLSAGKKYDRYIYANKSTNRIDSGWISSEWTNLSLKSGFSGYVLAKRTKLNADVLIEIKYDVKKSSDINSNDTFSELPVGYTLTQSQSIYEVHGAFRTGSAEATHCLFVIGGTRNLTLFRNDKDSSINRAVGHILFTR